MNPKLCSLAVMLLVAAAVPAFASTPVNKTTTVALDGDVRISNIAGSVRVTTWNRDEVHIGGSLGTGVKKLAVNKVAGGVDIQVVYPRPSSGNVQGSNLVVEVPRTSHLHVTTVSADVSATGLGGPVRLHTVSGAIDVQSTSAVLNAVTVSGGITINGSAPSARVNVDSVNGAVQIGGVGGDVDAHTVSGDISVNAAHLVTGAGLNTTSGNVKFAGALATQGSYKFNATSGNVTLDLAKVPAMSFDAATFSGDITTNFGPKPHRQSEYAPGKVWRFTSGTGSGHVAIATFSGNIRVHAAQR